MRATIEQSESKKLTTPLAPVVVRFDFDEEEIRLIELENSPNRLMSSKQKKI